MKILVTGANGYIGSRLIPLLAHQGHFIIAAVRDASRYQIPLEFKDQIEVIGINFNEKDAYKCLPRDIEAAYYLIHNLTVPKADLKKKEKSGAEFFKDYIDSTMCKQLIYLTGLISDNNLSEHLSSRLLVENILKQVSCSYTILRAATVIGAGSASFEIIRDLAEKLPIMVAPLWVSKLCQPIAIKDVIQYLVGVLGNCGCENKVFDIGGPEQISYKDLILRFAKVRGLKRYIKVLPVLTPKLSSLWLCLITTTNFQIARNLIDSMKNDVVCKENSIDKFVKISCLSYESAIKRALEKVEESSILSSWSDSFTFSRLPSNLAGFVQVPSFGCFTSSHKTRFKVDPNILFKAVMQIGGKNGYYWNWAWKFRGFIDKMIGGVGYYKGQLRREKPQPGDLIDFWRVILLDEENRRLLLFAEMKVPGEAWLEIKIKGNELINIATFRPKGIWGLSKNKSK
ncbi:MAG: DUF2867 domain-containing protein [Rhabdochlamydiaceae bacterium]|nr:DUF2867 domain-containing protein [Candidatus Amphrikana amoebophyrae]